MRRVRNFLFFPSEDVRTYGKKDDAVSGVQPSDRPVPALRVGAGVRGGWAEAAREALGTSAAKLEQAALVQAPLRHSRSVNCGSML